jgi:CheY-like chemotaxis protein
MLGWLDGSESMGAGDDHRTARGDEPDTATTEPTAPRRHTEGEALAHRCLLLVDDEPLVREVGTLMAESLGMTVWVAHDGEQAVERLAANPDDVDVILLDLTMPGMTGVETLERLRQIRADVPVVLTSGLGRESTALGDAEGDSAPPFLDKPFRIDELETTLQAALRGRGDG